MEAPLLITDIRESSLWMLVPGLPLRPVLKPPDQIKSSLCCSAQTSSNHDGMSTHVKQHCKVTKILVRWSFIRAPLYLAARRDAASACAASGPLVSSSSKKALRWAALLARSSCCFLRSRCVEIHKDVKGHGKMYQGMDCAAIVAMTSDPGPMLCR